MSRLVVGGSVGFFVAAIFNSILVVVKETNEGVHDWLAQVFTHHWLGQGIVVILVFLVVTALVYSLSKPELSESLSNKLTATVVAGALLSYLIIAGFFLL
jgi:membrane-bound acyltransferase YfiQ involved in biofilm formation